MIAGPRGDRIGFEAALELAGLIRRHNAVSEFGVQLRLVELIASRLELDVGILVVLVDVLREGQVGSVDWRHFLLVLPDYRVLHVDVIELLHVGLYL